MYALLSQNQNYIIERKSEANIRYENKKIENLNVEIKSKFERLKHFDEDAMFDMSDSSDEENQNEKILKDHSLTLESKKRMDSFASAQLKAEGKGGFVYRKIYCYKMLIKWLDVVTTALIVISTLTAQLENLYYYDLNLERRITAVKVANNILKQDFSTYNATLVDSVLNVTNYLSTINTTVYDSVYLKFEIDSYSSQLRYFIMLLTFISALLLIISRRAEYVRDYIYREKNEIAFIKTQYFWIMIFEVILVLPVQYPGITGYLLYREFGSPLCIPYSSLLSVFSLLRVYFLLKLFKHLTRWTSSFSELLCEKYVAKANTGFAFKAFQKENPFIMLFLIFIISCYCFGMAVRTFELYYWENFESEDRGFQNWRYQWNAMWFIFVSMTTVGYGDFTPHTQFGRAITILACLVGVYFVSMMMVFMTQKSLKNEKEEKAYKLITRLKYRELNKNLQSNLIYNFLKQVELKKQRKNEEVEETKFDIELKYFKRCMINYIMDIKENNKYIKSCDLIPTKEQLFDISEKLDSDIKDIKNEFDSLKNINNSLKLFTEDQLEIVDYLKKNFYATKLFYEIVEKHNKFGKLSLVTPLRSIEINLNENKKTKEGGSDKKRRMTNPQQWDPKPLQKIVENKNFNEDSKDQVETDNEELLAVNEYHEEKIRLYFDFMYAKENRVVPNRKTTKSRILTQRILDRSITRKDVIKKKLTKMTIKGDKILDAQQLTPSVSSISQ